VALGDVSLRGMVLGTLAAAGQIGASVNLKEHPSQLKFISVTSEGS